MSTLATSLPRSSTTSTLPLRTPFSVCIVLRRLLVMATSITRSCALLPSPPCSVLTATAFTKPPFACVNEGWGEFEISIDCYTTEKTKLSPIIHDLNFLEARYETVHTVVFKNPSQALQERLRETGPLPTDDDRPKKKGGLAGKKSGQKYDYEKIAEALEKLEEEDLLRVIQLINENKGPDTYIRSDVDGEFEFSCLPPRVCHGFC